MIRPEYLNKGDKIALVAPAGRVPEDKVISAKQTLEDWGLEVISGAYMFDHHFSYSATDEKRLADFQVMLDNSEIKAILCARGGYGTSRIIDLLDFSKFCDHPKWIIGFSDITVLHNHIYQNYGIETIHGSMASGLADSDKEPETAHSLKRAIFGEPISYEWENSDNNIQGSCSGELTGGNLAIICSLLGTPSEIDTDDKILFLEEVGEHLYRIDRMMVQLKRAGKLQNLKGLIIGDMSHPDDPDEFGKSPVEIICNLTKEYNFPVAFKFPAGHQPNNRTLIFGRNIQLTVGDKTVLNFDSNQ